MSSSSPVDFDPFATPALLRATASTESQRELWIASQLGPDASLAFNEALALTLRGELSERALERALTVLVESHEALHSCFSKDGTSLLVETPAARLATLDLSALEATAREEKLEEARRSQVTEPFDLSMAPLLRATLVRLEPTVHVLLLTAHHIVCDGWSMSVLVHDLAALYSRVVRGEPAEKLSRPRFSDYADEERKSVTTESHRQSEKYWLSRFADRPLPVLDLPTNAVRPALKSYPSDRVDHELDESLVAQLKSMGAKQGASFFATLLTGFQAFMHRLAGATDLVVGVPAAGQSRTGQLELIGHCVNMLPVRLAAEPGTEFTRQLTQTKSLVLDAYEHQEFTFGELLKKLALPRDPSRLPLMSVSFNLDQALTGEQLAFSGLEVEVETIPRAFENFDIFVNAAEKAGRIILETQYNTDLLQRGTVERWLANFETLLRGAAASPQASVAALPFATGEDMKAYATVNGAAVRDYPAGETLCSLLRASAKQAAEKPALCAVDGTLSYGELDRRSRHVAEQLHRRGIGRGSLVGVHLNRSSHLLVTVLGILRAGAAYVPLDPSFPSQRLTFMAKDAALALLISERSLAEQRPTEEVATVAIEDLENETASGWNSELEAHADDPAYVIYTSGSTGTPKGVIVPHRAAVNFLRAMAERPGLAPDDRLLAVTTLSFDISVLELFLPLSVGATVVLATTEQSADGRALSSLLLERDITVLQATPATWRLLLAVDHPFRAGFKALAGGEALPADLARALLARGAELWNMYGPTETTVWSTCERIEGDPPRISIGSPIANTEIRILNEQLQLAPVGVIGEICIGGAGVTSGYLQRPELTSERFVVDPFTNASNASAKLYRTGDLGRLRPDGKLECLGRIDTQVKLRGYRIELGEIESVLASHPGVRQCTTLVREDRPGDHRLVAYVVPSENKADFEELREHLRQFVPEYMVPQHFLELSVLPLTPNGKIDKKNLPAPSSPAPASAGAMEGPATEAEQMLADVWQQVLGLPQIDVTADFFQLGGHSLLVAQVIAEVARRTKAELSMRRFFEAPTVRGLARVLDESRGTAAVIASNPARTQAPLTAMQERLWFMEEMNPDTAVYNLPSCFRLRGKLDIEALRKALDHIAERHATLRTTLDWSEGSLVQKIAPEFHFPLAPKDLQGLPKAEQESSLIESLRAAAREPFELRKGPLVRAELFLLGDDESVFFFMPHHAIWDGWSFDVFLDELNLAYGALARGEAPQLAKLPVSYGDFAEFHREHLTSPALKPQIDYWVERLSGELPVLDLPTKGPRPPTLSFAGETLDFELSADLIDRLSELGKKHGATLYMVLLAAFEVLLFRVTGQTDLVVGTPIRGRMRPELEPLIGYFVNALPLRTQLDPEQPFNRFLEQIRSETVAAFGHQDAPFEVLIQKLKLERDTSRTPLYSAFFTFQDVRNRLSSIGDLTYEQIHVHAPVSPTDLSLWVKHLNSGLVGGIDYATDLFDRETVQRWLDELVFLLESITDEADTSLGALPLLPPRELDALAALSKTEADYPKAAYLHQLVEAQVDRTPEAVAVESAGARLTFAELDARANRLAHLLRELGAGPEKRVGICLDRSERLLVAALAVQKSGAAYVPLDPSFPKERLAFMVHDSGLQLLLAEEKTRALASSLTSQASGFEGEDAGRPPIQIVDLDGETGNIDTFPGTRLAVAGTASADAPVYVIYTSGSTGKPKGVVLSHRSVVNFLTSMAKTPGIAQSDRLLAITTLSFDIAVLELYLPLLVGARVIVASREVAQDGDLLDEAIDNFGVTMLQATPSTWRLLLAAGFRGGPKFKALCGGEAFPSDLAEQLVTVVGEVWNMYGPTETTVWSTCKKLDHPVGEVRIGRPIANTSVHVVDVRKKLVPWGSVGELLIGGDGVALGYHARPELTAERFVPNPFGEGRVYRTGDLVRLTNDGDLAFVRRNDNQVKLRGYRIELGEIEAVLMQHESVRQAVVLVREDRRGDQRLVAYVVFRGEGEIDSKALTQALRTHLPDYMIPQHLVPLPDLPLTPNGKIDRKALPAPDAGAASSDYLPPRSDNEKLLAELWQDVLSVSEVGLNDNFFDLGGHSMLCLQMTARLEQLTGERLNPRIVLRNNLAQIAAILDANREAPESSGARPVGQPANQSLARRLFGRLLGG